MAALRCSSPLVLAALLLLALVATCSGRATPHKLRQLQPRQGGRIVGGTAVDISQYPWQAYLVYSGLIQAWSCGASIISSDWVLTAAHCIEDTTVDSLSIRAGTSLRGSGGVLYSVTNGAYHANYETETDYDIGVLQVSGSLIGAGGVAAAISLATTEPADGASVTVTGWGDTSYGGEASDQLLAVTVSIIDRATCSQAYGVITDRLICAGDLAGGKDACQGDSGGPLVSGSTQVGVVSTGFECAVAGYPGIYTNVANLRSWISDVTGV